MTHSRASPFWILIPLFLLLALSAADAPAEIRVQTGELPVSPALIEKRMAEVQNSDLDEAVREQAVNFYRHALAYIEAARADRATAEQFAFAAKNAGVEAARIRREADAKIEQLQQVRPLVPNDASAREVELRYDQEKANEAAVKAKLEEIERNLKAESKRPVEARRRLAAASRESGRLAQERFAPLSPDESSVLEEARRWHMRTRAEALSAEIAKLDQALVSHPMRLDLLSAQRYETATTLDRIQERVLALKSLLTERRREQTERIIAKVDIDALAGEASESAIVELLERNRELVEELSRLTVAIESMEDIEETMRHKFEDVRGRHESAELRLGVRGVGQALGRALLDERRDMPDLRNYRQQVRMREKQIGEARLRDIQLDEQLRELVDTRRQVDNLLTGLPERERRSIRGAVEDLVEAHRVLLRQASELNGDYLRVLSAADYEQRRLKTAIDNYREFLSQRLLWVRNTGTLGMRDILALPRDLMRLFSKEHGLDIARTFYYEVTRSPLQILAALILLLSYWKRDAFRRALHTTAAMIGSPSQDTLRATFEAVGISLIIAVPWPLFIGVTGYSLTDSSVAGDAATAFGSALLSISSALFFLRVFRVLCDTRGVAESHFGWSSQILAQLRREMDLMQVTFVVPGLIGLTDSRLHAATNSHAVTQCMFVLLAFGLAWFLVQLFGRRRGVTQLSRSWLVLGALVPLGVAGMAVAGFLYSAGTLFIKLLGTIWLLFGLIFVHEMVIRWLLVARRRLLLAQAIKRQGAVRAAEPGEDEDSPDIQEPEIDLATLGADTSKLVRVTLIVVAVMGTLAIWSSVIPALAYFDEIALWYSTEVVDGAERLVPVTVVDLGNTILIVFMTFFLARTVPSLVEIVLRQRPTITTGSRLAFATLARYGIAMVGIFWAFDALGTSWSKLQWLVAALGVGIGFGLQEIIANFISGLIILMERPVRVGDTVTVGDATGKVTRIQIRATTLRNWNQQELLVPNKEFITGRVLNWSLSDEVIRIHFFVGVAYGSDVRRALDLMDEAIAEHPLVLEEPVPLVTFEGFGDNALNLGVRCYIASLNKRLETLTELHLAIERKLREADIVIAFPQRDVHLDTSRPLDIRVSRGPREPDAS